MTSRRSAELSLPLPLGQGCDFNKSFTPANNGWVKRFFCFQAEGGIRDVAVTGVQTCALPILMAFHAGYGNALGNVLETFQFTEPKKRSGHQIVMNGNDALGYGLIAAGVRFGAGYPITPWSDIMELLRRELPKYGGSFIQTEDEIAAVS